MLSSGTGATIEDAVNGVIEADVAEANRAMADLLGRLSYQSAWAAFSRASGGRTLHQLRHSAIRH